MKPADGGGSRVHQLSPALQWELEQFLYDEADLLDGSRWRDWLELLDPSIHYVVATRPNLYRRDLRRAGEGDASLPAVFDEDIASLTARVDQLEQHNHWAENPGSRTRRLISNVRVAAADTPGDLLVRSNFILYRTRMERRFDLLAGQRHDVLRDQGRGRWRILARTALLDVATVPSSNVSTLF